MKLREFSWWPRMWKSADGQAITPAQVSDAIFGTCKISPHGLMIQIDYRGRSAVGRIGAPSINAPDLERVRDFLADYIGDSMATVENLDVEPEQFRTLPGECRR
jgi:hypothetical protein